MCNYFYKVLQSNIYPEYIGIIKPCTESLERNFSVRLKFFHLLLKFRHRYS